MRNKWTQFQKKARMADDLDIDALLEAPYSKHEVCSE
jgi:hypothetical protein